MIKKLLKKLRRWLCKHPSMKCRYRNEYHTEDRRGIMLPMVSCVKYCLVCGKDIHKTVAFDWGYDVRVQRD